MEQGQWQMGRHKREECFLLVPPVLSCPFQCEFGHTSCIQAVSGFYYVRLLTHTRDDLYWDARHDTMISTQGVGTGCRSGKAYSH